MSLLPKSIHRCRRYPTKFNSGRDIPPNQLIRKATDLFCYVMLRKWFDVLARASRKMEITE